VAESTVLAGSNYYYPDHRAITVRYANWNGSPATWQFLAFWKTREGQHEHVVIDRSGVAWAESNLEERGLHDPLKPAQFPTIGLGIVAALVLGVISGVGICLAIQILGVLALGRKRPTSRVSTA
jgi:hypothetical protein